MKDLMIPWGLDGMRDLVRYTRHAPDGSGSLRLYVRNAYVHVIGDR